MNRISMAVCLSVNLLVSAWLLLPLSKCDQHSNAPFVTKVAVSLSYDMKTVGPESGSEANAVNESGQVVGTSGRYPFFFDGRDSFDCRPLIIAAGLNDKGVVVGRIDIPGGSTHAAMRNGAAITDLGTLPKGVNSVA